MYVNFIMLAIQYYLFYMSTYKHDDINVYVHLPVLGVGLKSVSV